MKKNVFYAVMMMMVVMMTACSSHDDDIETVRPIPKKGGSRMVAQGKTVLVYMAGRNNLANVVDEDLSEMKQGSKLLSSNDKVHRTLLGGITNLLLSNPYISDVNFVHFAGKKLVIDYTLKEIVLHVFTPNGEHYFVDSEGIVVPFTSK